MPRHTAAFDAPTIVGAINFKLDAPTLASQALELRCIACSHDRSV